MERVPVPRDGLETAYLDGEAVVFDERSGMVHRLNPSASAVWLLCDGTATVAAITEELAGVFGRPATALRADVEAALGQLEQAGLLEGGPPAPAVRTDVADDGEERAADGSPFLPVPPDP